MRKAGEGGRRAGSGIEVKLISDSSYDEGTKLLSLQQRNKSGILIGGADSRAIILISLRHRARNSGGVSRATSRAEIRAEIRA